MAGQTCSETGPLDAAVSNHFYGDKKRLKALSEAEDRCVAETWQMQLQ